jgi:NADH-quinone oxidoreductase subunit C
MPLQNNIEYKEIQAGSLIDTVNELKNNDVTRFDMLLSVSGVDKTECFEALYHLYSSVYNKSIVLKVQLDKNNPSVDTLSKIYSAANWHERETYDLFGIVFNNHDNLERLLLPKDWIGHPLRKDYVNNDERLSWNKR